MSQKLVFLQAVVLLTIFYPAESLVCFPPGLLHMFKVLHLYLNLKEMKWSFLKYLLHKEVIYDGIPYLFCMYIVLCIKLHFIAARKEISTKSDWNEFFSEHRKDKLFKVWCKLICANRNQWGVMSFHLIILQKWMRLVAVWLHQSTGENFLHIDFLSLSVNLKSSKILI